MLEHFEALPPRFIPVIELLALGRSNQAIAETTGLALHTVEVYVSDIKAMVGVESRAELALAARDWLDQRGEG